MAYSPRILIITGHGVNCEAESRYMWEKAGANASFLHLHDLLDHPSSLHDFDGLMLIGGFSYGDHMGSGQVMSQRLRHHVRDDFLRFIDREKLILGVCNGFQVMVKLGLLPGLDGRYFDQRIALMPNDCGRFQNFWVELQFESESPCIFTRGIHSMSLPIRHGEGKIFTLEKETIEAIEMARCITCRYVDPVSRVPTMQFPYNPNGSLHAIAGLNDPSGRIFGLMPHPEAYVYPENHPKWDFQRRRGEAPKEGLGLALFRNAVEYLR